MKDINFYVSSSFRLLPIDIRLSWVLTITLTELLVLVKYWTLYKIKKKHFIMSSTDCKSKYAYNNVIYISVIWLNSIRSIK